jgi:uncharacterized protein (TIGR02145 family)
MERTKHLRRNSIISIGLLLILTFSCTKENIIVPPLKIKAPEILSIGSNAVTISSKILNMGSEEVINQGICWNTQPSPSIDNNKKDGDLKDSTIFCRTSELTPNTKYYARTFVTNRIGTFYGDEIDFTTNKTVTDQDGNIYKTVTIGTQVWTVENLKTTTYNDGLAIPFVSENSTWSILNSAAYCWYDNDQKNKDPYGALYNWGAVNSGKLCPKGWHVPTDAEWEILVDNLGGKSNAAGLLKEVGTPVTFADNIATNYSGFSALPAGCAGFGTPTFLGIGNRGIWWTSTIDTNEFNIYWSMYFDGSTIVDRNGFLSRTNLLNGLSVRCIKDK